MFIKVKLLLNNIRNRYVVSSKDLSENLTCPIICDYMQKKSKEKKVWSGDLVGTRVVLFDDDAMDLYDESGFGKPMKDRLELDLIEALFLMEKKKLIVSKKEEEISFKKLFNHANKKITDFHPLFTVYKNLRERGYLCKTGFKFGTYIRCYQRGVKLKRGPKAPHEHTKWIVHPISEEIGFSFAELSRAVRLAQNIRASMLWAIVDRENDCTFYKIVRITP